MISYFHEKFYPLEILILELIFAQTLKGEFTDGILVAFGATQSQNQARSDNARNRRCAEGLFRTESLRGEGREGGRGGLCGSDLTGCCSKGDREELPMLGKTHPMGGNILAMADSLELAGKSS